MATEQLEYIGKISIDAKKAQDELIAIKAENEKIKDLLFKAKIDLACTHLYYKTKAK